MGEPIPIVRFGRWLGTLGARDFFAVGILAPVLGLVSMLGPVWLRDNGPRSDRILWDSVEHIAFGPSVILLFVSGAVVGWMSRKLGPWAASTTMLVYFAATFLDFVTQAPGHQLLPFELALYALLTSFAVAGAGLVMIVRG